MRFWLVFSLVSEWWSWKLEDKGLYQVLVVKVGTCNPVGAGRMVRVLQVASHSEGSNPKAGYVYMEDESTCKMGNVGSRKDTGMMGVAMQRHMQVGSRVIGSCRRTC